MKTILQKLENGSNLTLISNRRMGKTALIYRVFEELNPEKSVGIFVDVFSCTNLKSFTNSANRPFFASAQTIGLSEIPYEKYKQFIIEKFGERKRKIDEQAVDFVLDWTLSHTYYTQVICNSIFSECKKHINIEQVKCVCEEQLNMQQTTFMQYRDLLGPVQWKMLIAVAKEGSICEPQAKEFLVKHKIGAASSAKKALTALVDKEMVCTLETPEKTSYRVYNVFLMRWLDRTFK